MQTVAEVRMWGKTVGTVSLEKGKKTAYFKYNPDFAASGINISPLMMPPGSRTYEFPNLSDTTYHGLPGLLADSLPDKFGNTLIDTWLALQGADPEAFNAIERLCYTGRRGMGALEFTPETGPDSGYIGQSRLGDLVDIASKILLYRRRRMSDLPDLSKSKAFRDLLAAGTLAGGARAKVLVAWNPSTNEIRLGGVPAEEGFEAWLLKLDGVRGNRDKEVDDPRGFGTVEYAYSQMASDMGITMSDCSLFEENGRRHFMTKRFDRRADGGKLHMQSLCGLAHFDYNRAGLHSYEQVFQIIRQLGMPMLTIEEQFRRMVFNILTRNHDDHVKNIAFLMDEKGNWSLAPAFDLVYSYNPSGAWTACHQMMMNGKRDGFEMKDFKACAESAMMEPEKAEAIVYEADRIVGRWPDYAEAARVPQALRKEVGKNLRSF